MLRETSSSDSDDVGALALTESGDGTTGDGQPDPGPYGGDREVAAQQGRNGGCRCV